MSPFNLLLYGALAICITGVLYRVGGWFVLTIGINGRGSPVARRIGAAVKGTTRVFFSAKIFKILQTILLDTLFQRRIWLKAGFLRWLAHVLIFYGFLLLLLMHALDDIVTVRLFPDYYATLNPFLFLRSLFGVLVIIGLAIALGRRMLPKPRRVKTTPMDAYAILIVLLIVFSGVFLEGLTMTSHSEFTRMLEDYAGLYDEDEIAVLEGFWVENYALVSPAIKGSPDPEQLSLGAEIHETYCMSCHVSNKWGFLGFGTAKAISPFALWLDQHGGVTLFWYIHIVICFFALAVLPFTKMFHIISVPVSLMVSAVRDDQPAAPENLATINAMELSACTHCGVCTQTCSAAMMADAAGNPYILPSEKMRALKKPAWRHKANKAELNAVRQGVYVCTSCERCTVACPSGIRLKDLWENVKELLIQGDVPEPTVLSPFSFVRGTRRHIFPGTYEPPARNALRAVCGNGHPAVQTDVPLVLMKKEIPENFRGPFSAGDYAACFDCRNCTLICPVVANYEKPEETLGMLPHQIMCSLGLNLMDAASQSPMIWYCLTCYQCQEHCPQKVSICDLFYQLKNYAVTQTEGVVIQ